MDAVTVFNFQDQHEVRTVIRNGEPWFVAKDICDILELTNPTVAIESLDDDERSKYFLGRQGEVNIVNESGLYALVFKSRKPEAKAFRKWVTSDVLPTIRKTGRYEMQQVSQSPTPTELAQRDFIALKKVAEAFGLTHNRALISANIALRKRTGIDFQAELDVKLIAEDNSNYLLATEIGERLGLGTGRKVARHANLLLAEEGFQFKNERNEWRPTEKGKVYAVILDTGKAHHDGSMVQQLRWKESIVSMLQSCVKQYWRINNL